MNKVDVWLKENEKQRCRCKNGILCKNCQKAEDDYYEKGNE